MLDKKKLEDKLEKIIFTMGGTTGSIPESISLSYQAISIIRENQDISGIITGDQKLEFQGVRIYWSPELERDLFICNAVHPTTAKILKAASERDLVNAMVMIARVAKNAVDGSEPVKPSLEEIKKIIADYEEWVAK